MADTLADSSFTHLTPLQRQALIQKIDQILPQTQCRRCGYDDCLHYAKAIVEDGKKINLCPPGGTLGIKLLARLTQQPVCELAPEVGTQAPKSLAAIDESWCIGCTKCLRACPVDAIFGAKKMIHIVLPQHCTGCELCVPVCPVDCIKITPVEKNATTPDDKLWTQEQSHMLKERYAAHQKRMEKNRLARLQTSPQKESIPSPLGIADIADNPEQKKELLNSILKQAKEKLAQQQSKE